MGLLDAYRPSMTVFTPPGCCATARSRSLDPAAARMSLPLLAQYDMDRSAGVSWGAVDQNLNAGANRAKLRRVFWERKIGPI